MEALEHPFEGGGPVVSGEKYREVQVGIPETIQGGRCGS
jgi:hypothetical protein